MDERNGNHYFIGAQYREKDIKNLGTLLELPITDKDQKTAIPLRAIAEITPTTAPLEINHVAVDGKARKTAVKAGFRDGERVEILEGIKPGDAVILAGKISLSDGQRVAPGK